RDGAARSRPGTRAWRRYSTPHSSHCDRDHAWPGQRMTRVIVRVPATSANLGPGFDCLGLALDLHNTVTLDAVPRPVEPAVVVHGEGRDRLPRGGRNLALRAAQRVFRAATTTLFVSRIALANAIPVGGGLGSSAAAIAGAMIAANALI